MSPSATPARQRAAAPTASTGNQARHQSQSSAISAMPATQRAAATTASTGNQTRHQSQSSAISATPATQSARPCHQAPRLPRKVEVDVAKCHACHARSRGDNGVNWEPSAPPEPVQCHKCHACRTECTSMSPSATPAMQSRSRCHQVPRLPRKVKVDVAKCHACQAKSRGNKGVNWEPSAPPEPVQCHKSAQIIARTAEATRQVAGISEVSP